MKICMLLPHLLVWAVVIGLAAASCNYDTILAKCGDIKLHSIDDEVYGYNALKDWTVNVMDPVTRYNQRLKTDPYVEGRDNPDVAIAYAFMHYVCFDDQILNGEEYKIYECMREFCPRIENIESWCDGMAVPPSDRR